MASMNESMATPQTRGKRWPQIARSSSPTQKGATQRCELTSDCSLGKGRSAQRCHGGSKRSRFGQRVSLRNDQAGGLCVALLVILLSMVLPFATAYLSSSVTGGLPTFHTKPRCNTHPIFLQFTRLLSARQSRNLEAGLVSLEAARKGGGGR